jgi:hypothetical protein
LLLQHPPTSNGGSLKEVKSQRMHDSAWLTSDPRLLKEEVDFYRLANRSSRSSNSSNKDMCSLSCSRKYKRVPKTLELLHRIHFILNSNSITCSSTRHQQKRFLMFLDTSVSSGIKLPIREERPNNNIIPAW